MEPKAVVELLHLSAPPHIRQPGSVPGIMLAVTLALAPSFAASVYFFGIRSIVLTAVCVATCLLTEWCITHFLLRKPGTLGDLSALVTGVLLAFCLPPGLPWWMAAAGSVFAVAVAKWAFGGLGHNFVNPALAGRAFLMAAYPAAMSSWTAPYEASVSGLSQTAIESLSRTIDGIASATPLPAFSAIMQALGNDAVRQEISFQVIDFQDVLPRLLLGNTGGCIGETSALALILGAVFLWYRGIIGFRIPTTFIATVFILSWLFNGTSGLFTTEALIVPVYQVLAGGLILGALFMATDSVTSPKTGWGKVIFGSGCGVLTFAIRKFGGYPEGVCYAILIMNLTVPLLDRSTASRVFGGKRVKRA